MSHVRPQPAADVPYACMAAKGAQLFACILHLQEFPGAERIVQDVEAAGVTVTELQQRRIVQDDRIEFTVTDSALLFGSRTRGSW